MINELRNKLIDVAVCDTRFTPTLNFNEIFNYVKDDFAKVKNLQKIIQICSNKQCKLLTKIF